jgi:hypothetical protein
VELPLVSSGTVSAGQESKARGTPTAEGAAMTGSNPAGEQVEGNVADLDFDARFFTLEDRTGKVFIKIYWKPAHEEKMRKQKPGYYEAPFVEMEEKTGGLQEAVLVDLPYKDRGDFPRAQKKGGQGGRPYTPRNEKIVVYECVYKANADNIRAMLPLVDATGQFNVKDFAVLYNDLMDIAMARTLKDAAELCRAGGA